VLLAEEFLLLCLDDDSGKKTLSSEKLPPALGAAILVELALMERIGVTPHDTGWQRRGRVRITDTKPTDDAELDAALAAVEQREDVKVKDLISDMSGKRITKGLQDRLAGRLVASGALGEERSKVLGLRRWPTADPGPEQEVVTRLQSSLVGNATPTERTVALIALLQATGQLTKVVSTSERKEDQKALKARAKALTEGDWAAAAVKQAIDEVYAMVASMAAVSAGGGGTGGT
jgi:hypothetical protein